MEDGEGGFDLSANTFTHDGISILESERILIKNGINSNSSGVHGKWNGIYTVGSLIGETLTLTRSDDFNSIDNVTAGASLYVEKGTSNGEKTFILTTTGDIIIGTTAMSFSLFSSGGGGGGGGEGTDVTLASVTDNYLSISGQEITAGTVPVSLGGTGATSAGAARTALGVDAAGTDNSTDVTLANTNYLSISGQEITGGTVPISSGGTGATSAGAARTALGVDAAGTDNSTDVTLANTNYLSYRDKKSQVERFQYQVVEQELHRRVLLVQH